MATTSTNRAYYQHTLSAHRKLAKFLVDGSERESNAAKERGVLRSRFERSRRGEGGAPVVGSSATTSESVSGTVVAPASSAVSSLQSIKGKGPDVRKTSDGHKVIKAKVGLFMAFKMLFAGYIHPVEQLKIKHMLADYDDPAEDPVEELTEVVEEVRKPRHSNANWWAGYALLAHAHFQSPVFNRKNEMCVSTWIRKSMEADNVRRITIAQVLPLAVRMAFVPTEADVLAVKVDNAPAVKARYEARDTRYWTAWFTARRGHYESG